MARGKSLVVSFKSNHQYQGMLLPPDLSELVAQNHPVRVVSDILDKVDIGQLMQQYKPGGASNYHPRMLQKVLVFAYINNIYSSRKIEEALHQNINFMWLSGMSKPDHNTINRFRGQRLQKTLQPIFTQVVLLLCEEGVLSLKELYTDGTKIEANANRYTFVWGNSIKNNKAKMQQQLNELWQYAQSIAAAELDDDHDPSGFDKIASEKIEQTIATINEALKDKPIDKKIRQRLNYAKKNWPSALARYAEQENIMGDDRSSYSKTDEDATFMRMKEDHMKNGQLKPAYNLQISTNNQYIVNYSLHQNTTDTNTLQGHLNIFRRQYGKMPSNITADAGYGSEQNYEWLEKKRITAYVKYNHFDRDQHGNSRNKNPYRTDKLTYDQEKDKYICPSGKTMKNIGSHQHLTKAGFKQTITRYKAGKCNGCPLRSDCHGQKGIE